MNNSLFGIKRKNWLLIAVAIMSLISAVFDGIFYWRNLAAEPSTVTLNSYLSLFLLVIWIDTDSKEHPEITRPLDYGFLVWTIYPVYFPYYLWKTRRTLGLLWLTGFGCLISLGALVQWMIYYLNR